MLPTQINKSELNVIHNMDTVELKKELAKTLTVTADYLAYIAAIWIELESRGEDLSALRHGMMAYIPLIATRQLDARIVVNYAGQKTLLSAMSKLPLHQQQKLIESNTIELAEVAEDGEMKVNKVSISGLSSAQVYQAFGDGEVKSPERQYKILLTRQKTKAALKAKKTYRMTSRIKIDGDNLVINGNIGVDIKKIKNLLQNIQKTPE